MKIRSNTEPQWAGEHILSEANGKRSVEEIQLATGVVYPAGSVLVRPTGDNAWRAIKADDLGASNAAPQKAPAASDDGGASSDSGDGKTDTGSSKTDSGDAGTPAPTSLELGVLYAPVDATDVDAAFGLAHVRDAEVAGELLHWFDGASDGQIAVGESFLKKAGLIVRR